MTAKRLVALLWLLETTAGALEENREARLLRQLFVHSGYDKDARPVYSPGTGVNVAAMFGLNAIIKFDAYNQVLKTTSWILLGWADPGLVWNSSDSTLSNIFVPAGKIWRPWLYVTNSVNGFERLGNEEDQAYVQNTGRVLMIVTQLLETTCKMDISKYPFDTQTCAITIGPIYGHMSNTTIRSTEASANLQSYENNTEWDIKCTNISYLEFTEGVMRGMKLMSVKLELERRSLFYLITLILPVPCLSVLTPTVFVLPPDGGEKISLAISVMLSYTIFLSGLNGSLPPNSDTVCYFSVYLGCMVVISSLSSLLASLIITLYSRQGQVSCAWSFIMCACHRRRERSRVSPLLLKPEAEVSPISTSGGVENSLVKVGDVITRQPLPEFRPAPAEPSAGVVTWQEVSLFLDRVGLLLCLLLTMTCTAIFVYFVLMTPSSDGTLQWL